MKASSKWQLSIMELCITKSSEKSEQTETIMRTWGRHNYYKIGEGTYSECVSKVYLKICSESSIFNHFIPDKSDSCG